MVKDSWIALVVGSLFLIMPTLVVVAGFCSILWPRFMWYLSEGWKFKNAEPSGCALVMTRIGGLFLVVAGTVFLLLLFGSSIKVR